MCGIAGIWLSKDDSRLANIAGEMCHSLKQCGVLILKVQQGGSISSGLFSCSNLGLKIRKFFVE